MALYAYYSYSSIGINDGKSQCQFTGYWKWLQLVKINIPSTHLCIKRAMKILKQKMKKLQQIKIRNILADIVKLI